MAPPRATVQRSPAQARAATLLVRRPFMSPRTLRGLQHRDPKISFQIVDGVSATMYAHG